MPDPTYLERLNAEADFWGDAAAEQAATVEPDWSAHRRLLHNAIQTTPDVDALLDRVQPGMRALEIGCGPGWLTLAMAARGARAHGVDIAARAIEVARARYASIKHDVRGEATFAVVDLNETDFGSARYDLVVAKGVLHHLERVCPLIERVYDALTPGGLFWVSDTHGFETQTTAIVAGAIMAVLPTHVSYAEKLKGLGRFGIHAPARVQASMEARGASPFEGVARSIDWPAAIERLFDVESKSRHGAVTGYIAHELRAPDAIARPLLRLLGSIDRALVRGGLLQSTGLTIYARKRQST